MKAINIEYGLKQPTTYSDTEMAFVRAHNFEQIVAISQYDRLLSVKVLLSLSIISINYLNLIETQFYGMRY